MRSTLLAYGEPAPWFECASSVNPKFYFDTVAGRFVVLTLFRSASEPATQAFLAAIDRRRDLFDDWQASFFGMSHDPDDQRLERTQTVVPGIRFFWDFDHKAAGELGAIAKDGTLRPVTFLFDPRLRLIRALPFDEPPEQHAAKLFHLLDSLPRIGLPTIASEQAPVLIVPRVFEPELCRRLIQLYEDRGGTDSGFMRDVNGKTVGILDYSHKRRRDYEIEDESLRRSCMIRIHDRLAPELHKATQFKATRMERYTVACYDASEEGHFNAHRDNTTKGTAHRRFAVSLMLNTGEYEGGYLRFPEFGPQAYTAPAGGAVVFSCSLLHEATVVTKGRRYVFIPFLYDDAAAREREENLKFISDQATLRNP